MALIAEETILEVKRALDIVEVVQSYIPLRRAGSNYKAPCPFHEEKTPSFNVNPERQIFKCFGCGKGGDVIKFVMDFEKADYPEAIRLLADRCGVAVRYTGGNEGGIDRRDLLRANEWAGGAFRGLLKRAPEAEPARQFLARRGVSDETAELFGLGYSLPAWDGLLGRGRRADVPEKLLAAAGLAIPREGKRGFYDRFRGRVMFPIHDARGKVIAFGARTLGDDTPKFINSPETAVFAKGKGFYGLHLAREEFEQSKTAYIVEGYLDVIVPYQAGARGLVATLGTALTREHLKVLRRYVDKVVLVFDADAAGQKASERGLELLLAENMELFVAQLPPGQDPDDVVVKQGADRLRECLEKPQPFFDFLLESLLRRHGGETPTSKARVVEEMLDRLALVGNEVTRELLVQQLARRFGLEERTLKGRLRKSAGEEPPPEPVRPPAATPTEAAARELLACAVADATLAGRLRQELPADRYPTEALRGVAREAYRLFDRTGEVNGRDLVALMREPDLIEAAAEVLVLEVDREGAPQRVKACLDALARADYRAESKDRRARLRNASPEEETELLRQLMEARKRRPQDHGLLPGR